MSSDDISKPKSDKNNRRRKSADRTDHTDREPFSEASTERSTRPRKPKPNRDHKSPGRISDVSHGVVTSGFQSTPPLPTGGQTTSKAYTIEALAGLSAILPTDPRSHLAITGKQLLHAWRNNKFCDVILKAEHSLFYAHLEVFVAFSDYFDDIPTERKQQHINLGDVKPDDAATILKYLYFGELQANAENIYGVWMIARALKIHDVTEACGTFIERLLTPKNLVYVMEFCEQRNIPDLHAAAYDRFVLMFYEQTSDKHFLEWDVGKVARLLGCDDLKVKTELDVYAAMKAWIDFKRPERISELENLVVLIRFAHMTRDEIVQCTLMDPSFLEFRKVKELLATANWYITMQQSGRHWSEFQLPRPRHPPRKGENSKINIVSAHREPMRERKEDAPRDHKEEVPRERKAGSAPVPRVRKDPGTAPGKSR